MPFDRDPKSGIRIFTQKIYTTGIILNKNITWFKCYSRTPSTIAASHCLVSFALSPCIHLERIVASGRMIPPKEESIGTLIRWAAKWGIPWSSRTRRKWLLMLLKMEEDAVLASWKNWSAWSLKEHLYWKSHAMTSTTEWGSLKASARRRNNGTSQDVQMPHNEFPRLQVASTCRDLRQAGWWD